MRLYEVQVQMVLQVRTSARIARRGSGEASLGYLERDAISEMSVREKRENAAERMKA